MKGFRWLFLALLLTAGCDSGGDDGLDVVGTWETRGDDIIFLVISETSMTSYDFMGDAFDEGDDCYVIEQLNVLEISDTAITIQDADLGTLQATVSISGDRMIVSVFGFAETYYRSNRAVSSFTPSC